MAEVPAWVGWPGTGPAPGHDWLPGPALRFVILLLAYSFLALALTVDYAYSVTFFLLAIIGVYVGLRRGFANGLTKAEILVMLVFAAYPAVAIISYLAGTQTNIGFRFLGRDLRFLLFVPVYLALRWSRPKAGTLGIALGVSAAAALGLAVAQHAVLRIPEPPGVAGTHITFGDLALLSGVLGAALLLIPTSWTAKERRLLPGAAAVTVAGAGLAVCVISGARGGWIAAPVLLAITLLDTQSARGASRRTKFAAFAAMCATVLVVAAGTPQIRKGLGNAMEALNAYMIAARADVVNAKCVDERQFLGALLRASDVSGPGAARIVSLDMSAQREVSKFGCSGRYAVELTNPAGSGRLLVLSLYRGLGRLGGSKPERQSATVLAIGTGSFSLGWKRPWERIRNVRTWRSYTVRQSYEWLGAAMADVYVPPGGWMRVIPIQEPRGVFAAALAGSSLGDRLGMWRAAWGLFLMHPWLGVGTGAFQAAVSASQLHLPLAENWLTYEHAHSDYLTVLATSGLLGELTLLLALTAPSCAMLWRSGADHDVSPVAPGQLLAAGFAIFAVTETMFVHSLAISWYVVGSAMLLACNSSTDPPS